MVEVIWWVLKVLVALTAAVVLYLIGAKLLTTMLHELERTGGRYGLQTMCEGGGMANATIIERLG